MFPYDPVEDDELTLREGDILTILEKDGDWWKASLNGRTGLAPANYLAPA